jgi:hypothetical protein
MRRRHPTSFLMRNFVASSIHPFNLIAFALPVRLMTLVAKDAAINDAIYALGDHLAHDLIDAEVYIKVRRLAG